MAKKKVKTKHVKFKAPRSIVKGKPVKGHPGKKPKQIVATIEPEMEAELNQVEAESSTEAEIGES